MKEFDLEHMTPDADGSYVLEDPNSITQKINLMILEVKFNPKQYGPLQYKVETFILPVFSLKVTHHLKFFTFWTDSKLNVDKLDKSMVQYTWVNWHPCVCYLRLTVQRTSPTTVKMKPEEWGWYKYNVPKYDMFGVPRSYQLPKYSGARAIDGYKIQRVVFL